MGLRPVDGMTGHSLLYFLARAGAGLLMTATLAVFTRLLTPSEYGAYALGVTVASIAAALLFQWLTVAVGRFYPAFLERPGILVAASGRGFRAGSLAAALALVVALPFRHETGASLPALGTVLLATLALGRYNLLLQVANSQRNPRRYALLNWLKSAAVLLAGTGFMLLGAREVGALAGFAAGHALAVLVCNPLRGVRPVESEEARQLSPRLFRYGMPLVFTFLGTLAVDFADRLLIAWRLGVSRVGPYAAAYDLTTQSIGAITNILFLAAFPAAIHAFEHEGEDAARGHMRSLGRALIAVGLPAAVGFSALSRDIADVLLGESFRGEAVAVMPVVAVALWIGGFKSYYLDTVFQLRRSTGFQAYIALSMMVVNVGLNLVLLPVYGILGAAWATLAALGLGAMASYILGRGLMQLHPLGVDFVRGSAACGIMALAILMLPGRSGVVWLIAKTALGGAVYLAAAWLVDLAGFRAWLVRHLARAARRP